MAEVLQPEGQTYFSHSPVRRSPASSFLVGSPSYSPPPKPEVSYKEHAADLTSSLLSPSIAPRDSAVDVSQRSSFSLGSSSTLQLGSDSSETDDDSISLPLYENDGIQERPSSPEPFLNLETCGNGAYDKTCHDDDVPVSPRTEIPPSVPSPTGGASGTGNSSPAAHDDTAVRQEPSRHVDYLSHDWAEEDIWTSWRHIVSKRKVYGERSRLENASWRTWTKSKYKLRTVSPETLNWLKDHDVTWLYGPLQPARQSPWSRGEVSEPASNLSRSNSFLIKKPILKKRSMSEIMLQKSLSTSSLVKQAADAVRAQQSGAVRGRPTLGRATSDFVPSTAPSWSASRDATDYSSKSTSTSGLQTPDPAERKHIRFDDNVEQCIAVEGKDGDDDDFDEGPAIRDDDDSSDDGVVMMKSNKQRPLSRNSSRTSFTAESKTIAKLPSTTLKYRTDSPDITQQPSGPSTGLWGSKRLSPSSSQETLRPSNPSSNFLLDDDDDEDMTWEPSGAFGSPREADRSASDIAGDPSGPLRRTSSGMFMPFSEEDDDEPPPRGVLGRVVDTVNTAKDIAHVIWNVGWQ